MLEYTLPPSSLLITSPYNVSLLLNEQPRWKTTVCEDPEACEDIVLRIQGHGSTCLLRLDDPELLQNAIPGT
eukprot:5649012-Pyramimonas_sp.AAC.1